MPETIPDTYTKEILDLYKRIKPEIVQRISDFRKIWKDADNNTLFTELSFCLFIVSPEYRTQNLT